MSHYFPKLLSFQANFRNFGIRLMKLGLFLFQFRKLLKIWPMFIPVFALNKGSSLYQEVDFEPGGGVLELFFDGVCGPRSETPTHI